MNQEQKTMLDEIFDAMPPAIKWAADDTAWDYVCPQIALRHDLTEIQSSNLTVEVGLYLSNTIDMKEFVYELQKITDENEETTKNIMRELLSEIFEPFSRNIKQNKQEINNKISDMNSEIAQLNSEITENTNGVDGFPAKPSTLFTIPIKKKKSDEPIMVTKTQKEFSNIQKPSAYVSKSDPYHEEF